MTLLSFCERHLKTHPKHWIVGLVAAIDIAVIVATVAWLSYGKERYHEEAERNARNIGRVMEISVTATLRSIDLALGYMAEEIALCGEPAGKPSCPGTRQTMERHGLHLPEAQAFAVASAEGFITTGYFAHRNQENLAVDIRDRQYFQRLQADPASGLVISPPQIGRITGRWAINLARPLLARDGSFRGAIIASLDLEHWQRLLSTVDIGPHGALSVRDAEMGVILRFPEPQGIGTHIGAKNISPQLKSFLEKKVPAGVYRAVVPLDGIERTVAFTRSSLYPIYVNVGLSAEDYLAPWRKECAVTAAMLGLFFLFTAAGGGLLWRLYRSQLLEIAQRRQAEDTLRHARDAADAANAAKSRFLATMSHELRTPMNGILGMAQMLLMPNLTAAETQEYARTILNSGKALLTLLNDILDLSKVEAGKLELSREVFAPRQLLEEMAALFGSAADDKRLALEVFWEGEVQQRYEGDPLRLRQMLANLLSNAIKFTDHGHIRLHAQEIRREGTAATLRFAVRDTGIGIAAEKQALLFRPFSQIDDSTTRSFSGTGLGLSIVRNLAELMGGQVGLESGVGRGSTFWFEIRAERLESGETGAAPALPTQGELLRPAAGFQPHPYRILLADDNATNRKVVAAMLDKLGFQVDFAANGEEAVAAVTCGDPPDLVLMDCQMPVLDGFAATRRIREREAEQGSRRLPIVALTALAFEQDKERCLAAGMDEFLAKPVKIDGLLAILQRRLGLGGTPLPAAAPARNGDRVFNRKSLLGRCANELELARYCVEAYLDDSPHVIERLTAAIADKTGTEVRRHAHSLKGAASNVSGETLVAMARQVEDAGAAENLELAGQLLPELKAAATRLDRELASFLADGE